MGSNCHRWSSCRSLENRAHSIALCLPIRDGTFVSANGFLPRLLVWRLLSKPTQRQELKYDMGRAQTRISRLVTSASKPVYCQIDAQHRLQRTAACAADGMHRARSGAIMVVASR